jgi:alpha-beta hydrolase superfamily lysophospholipase
MTGITATPRIDTDALVMDDGARLPLSAWRAERPRAVIVALHGFNGYAIDFELPGPWFAAHGVTLYAYDQRGFGRHEKRRGVWPGSERLTADLREAVELVARRHPGLPVYVLGFSMGGAVALKAAAEGLKVDGLILAAPAVWGWQAMNRLYRTALWVSAHTFPAATASGRSLGIQASDNLDWLTAWSRDPLVIKETRYDAVYGLVGLMDDAYAAADRVRLPALFVYGGNDEIIPEEPTRSVMRRYAGPKRIVIYEDGWHMVLQDLQREQVYRDIIAWLSRPDAPLPSGEEVEAP